MATDVIAGARDTFDTQADYLLPLEDSLNVLKDRGDWKSLLKLIGIGKPVHDYKHTWFERNETLSKETITLADGSGTAVTVADTAAYKVGDILAVEAERMRVTARTNATTLAVTRAYAGTTGAAHSAKVMYNLGLSESDGADAPEARSVVRTPIYNYVQTFAETAELPIQVIMANLAGGNPMTQEIADMTQVFWRRLFQAVLLGVRYEDTSGEKRQMGGVEHYVTNVTAVGGAVTKAVINAAILAALESDQGGNIDDLVILTSLYQASKINDLDASKVQVDYSDKTTGNQDIQFYKPGLGISPLRIVADVSVPRDKLYILNTRDMQLRPQVGNGESGRAALYEAKTPGKAHQKKVIRGLYTFEVKSQATNRILSGLT